MIALQREFTFFLKLGEDGNKHSVCILSMNHMRFEPVIVFIQGNSDAFIGFWKEVGSFLDTSRSISTIPPLFENNLTEAAFMKEIGYLRT